MKRIILLLLIATACVVGCKKDEKVNSKFTGSYKGSYTGGDAGTLTVNIDQNGSIKGTSVSSRTLESFSITGNVDANGSFIGSTDIGTTFTGTFTSTSVAGNWNNTSLKLNGTWTGNKQ